MGPGKTIVTILCDYGTRYQSKLFNPEFLRDKGLPVPGLAGTRRAGAAGSVRGLMRAGLPMPLAALAALILAIGLLAAPLPAQDAAGPGAQAGTARDPRAPLPAAGLPDDGSVCRAAPSWRWTRTARRARAGGAARRSG